MNTKKIISASFLYVDDFVNVIKHFKSEKRKFVTYSPVPNHEIEEALGAKKSKVGLFTLAGGIIGLISGFSLAGFTAAEWNLVLGGKPPVTLIPFVVIGFEFTILFGALATLLGLIINAKLPSYKKLKGYKPEFTVDHFGISLEADETEVASLTDSFNTFGAKEVTYE